MPRVWDEDIHDVPHMIDLGILDGLFCEEVVRDKFGTSGLKRIGVLLLPDSLGLLDHRRSILDHELQLGMDLAELEGQAA